MNNQKSKQDDTVCIFFLKSNQVKFFTVDLEVGKAQDAFQSNLNFLYLRICKILQFKINDFPRTCHFVRTVTKVKLLEIWIALILLQKQLFYKSDSFTLYRQHLCCKTLFENKNIRQELLEFKLLKAVNHPANFSGLQ